MRRPWPSGFARIPDEDWTRGPVEQLALKYDTVEDHGWYRNLDRTVHDLAAWLQEDHVLLDYSGGTGILAARLLEEISERGFGVLIVDSSPKFLRLAVEKLGRHERVAFRLMRYLKPEKRLQRVQEVIETPMLDRGVDAVVSTNAIHLYYDLRDTLRSWRRILRPHGRVFIQSGNIGLSDVPAGSWIIDETVEAIHREATQIVRTDSDLAAYRDVLDDATRMAAHDAVRRKFFLPVRPLEHYLSELDAAGLRTLETVQVPIEAHVDQWYEFLSAYHEGVLGWVGGSRRVEKQEPSETALGHRLELIGRAMERIFEGRRSFQAIWTYITAQCGSRAS